jgi:tRNA U34 5-methylaminomethyl-2-thiouridine-forming methyltransferase MnmC
MEKKYTQTDDGTLTLYSKQYKQNYHSARDGALSESLHKHVIPAFEIFKNKKKIYILDICFGLGYNILATLYYIKKNMLDCKVYFYSPELDRDLIKTLGSFKYPKELENFKDIINTLIDKQFYKDDTIQIELFLGDARTYIQNIKEKIDVVYQDAFSSDVNKELWTKEYFGDITKLLAKKALITTYSIATPVRLSMSENGLQIFEYKIGVNRKSTLASNFDIQTFLDLKYIDMEKKKINNPNAKALVDNP